MKTFYLSLICCFTLVSSTYSQAREEKAKKKYEAEMDRKQDEYISDFLATIEVDDFQKEIITQSMKSYFEEFKNINMLQVRDVQRQELIQNLDNTHFVDLKAMVSEDTMSKIMDALKGKWKKETNREKKKRLKKEKKKNKN
ncbi:hypothetical protein [Psychroserpens sp.]|uniref:hypothetical protein n=1 Tax=Psychroserpens sp. TaxID=2020870 RepID=UPI001B18CEF0|nr:hypothetical protein [Psychroserpens sp.]MBO6606584.1 hypothetical protein [Psychroserpens sp.]MBO6653288.1 hypothetical protein [Psychroserpens sp.]MBO6680685.1 hypothetical protein [Psychroserpens sp.]MBO6750357.1 hypothetical protein [Psychroserpens sp.]MBO6914839.1 hypothetical protein [Psychroserpens sp.]